MNNTNKILNLPGPILIIGASGFVGYNLFKACTAHRTDVIGSYFSTHSWRLKDTPDSSKIYMDFNDSDSVKSVLNKMKPKTIFDCSSYGAYSFEKEFKRIHATNYLSLVQFLELIATMDIHAYIHAGSSSEYGLNASAPKEDALLIPNSHYALSKVAASQAITYYGTIKKIPVMNLRLYSVYGPYEDSSRLIPQLCLKAMNQELPLFASPEVSRDYIFIDDVIAAFVDAALNINSELFGASINIGTGVKTTLSELATLAKNVFLLQKEPVFDASLGRAWDVNDWYSNPEKAKQSLKWSSQTSLEQGLLQTFNWWKRSCKEQNTALLTKQYERPVEEKNSITAVIACYKDAEAIPIMYERLVAVFKKINLEYEIIFINDNSPDNSAEIIRAISSLDPCVLGINHSRNFGSQSAFRSGMELASKQACVLLDGDLQDPPEMIEDFVRKWREGADIVYGVRIKREMSRWLEQFYRGFYHLFSILSEVPIPKNVGDFSLIDHTAVHWMLQCQEKDAFLRGLRAYIGFKQVGIDYVRPERMFGKSTNNWIKNIGWAKKGIFSFSRTPLHLLTAFGGFAFLSTLLLGTMSILTKIIAPQSVPNGITFLSLLVMGFGSATLLSLGLIGEYIGKIIEETKARPTFIRKNIIVNGQVKSPEHCIR